MLKKHTQKLLDKMAEFAADTHLITPKQFQTALDVAYQNYIAEMTELKKTDRHDAAIYKFEYFVRHLGWNLEYNPVQVDIKVQTESGNNLDIHQALMKKFQSFTFTKHYYVASTKYADLFCNAVELTPDEYVKWTYSIDYKMIANSREGIDRFGSATCNTWYEGNKVLVSFLSHQPYTPEATFEDLGVEMIVATSLASDVQYYTNLGIQRLICENSHQNVALLLHAFTGLVLEQVDPTRKFMVTIPTGKMLQIMLKAALDENLSDVHVLCVSPKMLEEYRIENPDSIYVKFLDTQFARTEEPEIVWGNGKSFAIKVDGVWHPQRINGDLIGGHNEVAISRVTFAHMTEKYGINDFYSAETQVSGLSTQDWYGCQCL